MEDVEPDGIDEDDVSMAPATSPDEEDEHPLSESVAREQHRLIGGEPTLTIGELAETSGVSVGFARTFWRAMGFPNVADDERAFTEADAVALRSMAKLISDGLIDKATAVSLLRAQSHTTDRLVLWQTEALVEGFGRQLDLDDTSARLVTLDRVGELQDVLEQQLLYAWRRQLAALLVRIDGEVAQRGADADPDALPLARGLGFVDMVAYTRRSAALGSHALAELVSNFDLTARDVITSHGARVVKTVGDAVLFVADDVSTTARVAVELIAALQGNPTLLPVRASMVWGRVVSRAGDIFGPAVNLASRLVDVAPTGSVLTDAATAEALKSSPDAAEYTLVPRETADLQGLGLVTPIEVRRRPT